eukprot:355472-Chlamydomonas_euryale.AAC.9
MWSQSGKAQRGGGQGAARGLDAEFEARETANLPGTLLRHPLHPDNTIGDQDGDVIYAPTWGGSRGTRAQRRPACSKVAHAPAEERQHVRPLQAAGESPQTPEYDNQQGEGQPAEGDGLEADEQMATPGVPAVAGVAAGAPGMSAGPGTSPARGVAAAGVLAAAPGMATPGVPAVAGVAAGALTPRQTTVAAVAWMRSRGFNLSPQSVEAVQQLLQQNALKSGLGSMVAGGAAAAGGTAVPGTAVATMPMASASGVQPGLVGSTSIVIRKPVAAYHHFMASTSQRQSEVPQNMRNQAAKHWASIWHSMSAADKQRWVEKAQEDRARYNRQVDGAKFANLTITHSGKRAGNSTGEKAGEKAGKKPRRK